MNMENKKPNQKTTEKLKEFKLRLPLEPQIQLFPSRLRAAKVGKPKKRKGQKKNRESVVMGKKLMANPCCGFANSKVSNTSETLRKERERERVSIYHLWKL
jgi:hypothetical protein